MADEAVGWILRTLMETPAVNAFVGPRVFKTHISEVPTPIAPPLVTVHRARMGAVLSGTRITDGDLVVTAHSAVDQEQAWALYLALETVLDHVVAQGEATGWWHVSYVGGPFETVDTTEEPLYQVHGLYRIVQAR